jgi:HPt (histidine-containing phosphotransfer) domain-containing protein
MGQTKSLNADVIDSLKALGGMELLAELHTVFISSSTSLIADIHAAIAANDPAVLQEKAHSLKSSSGNMGALQLSEMCSQLEKMGQTKNLDQAKMLSQALDTEFKQVCIELAEVVKNK